MTADPDDVPGGVISLGEDMRIRAANRTMGELVGRSLDELVGAPLDILLSAPSKILFQTHVYPALKADGRVEEVFLTLAAGHGRADPRCCSTRSDRPMALAPSYDGLLVRINARARWESELLAATRALEQERAASQRLADELAASAEDLAARYAAEQRDREFRDAFIGVISHELRTPITTIYGMSHILHERHESMEPEAVRQHLSDIEAESDRLRRLTEDLLVLSRAEGGRLRVADDPVIVGRVVRSAVESERRRVTDHPVSVEIEPALPLVFGEDLYLEQVVRNFMSNAAKYSPAGAPISRRGQGRGRRRGGARHRCRSGPRRPIPRPAVRAVLPGPRCDQPGGRGGHRPVRLPRADPRDGRPDLGRGRRRPTGGAEFGFWLPAAADLSED